jgi:putative proteasome-type protease
VTYCLGMLVQGGLIMMADTRTNAGVDNISSYRKLRVFGGDGKRLIVVCSAGNLSTSQGALQQMMRGVPNPETMEVDSWQSVSGIYEAARAAGRAVRLARDGHDSLDQSAGVNFDASLLVGGAVGGEAHRLFLVYAEGNVIECGPDTPYLQIGEAKYGKPILDRALRFDTTPEEALKIGLISFEATMRANLAVGLPIDILVSRAGGARIDVQHRIDQSDAYFRDLSQRWADAMIAAVGSVPLPPYGSPA